MSTIDKIKQRIHCFYHEAVFVLEIVLGCFRALFTEPLSKTFPLWVSLIALAISVFTYCLTSS